ncbi:hypothetical protein UFOVP662_51 [uncultured Caudovirales phage]|uniref:Uncharacterized protein n=1 Tax=uncultured Caudovirales phage TaxID=2100421 RepID=A0A6J5QKW0_9CAUD|nr:hypothetical protein UFOVP662_51 [uncultured Caudovirales phage]CAB4181578.1 hypothetical protein UFOVP1067_51 [uncultured Caudovirales phage]
MSPEERKELIKDIVTALGVTATSPLSDEENRWVKMAIQKEAQSIELRKAIIEKTIGSLVWMCLVGIGYVFLDFARTHIFK